MTGSRGSAEYVYDARLIDIVDGDTIDVTVDLGFNITRDVRLRLMDVDTAEIFGVEDTSDEYQRGMKHKQYVSDWLECDVDTRFPLRIGTHKKGKFGRYIATVWKPNDNQSLNAALLSEFDDVEY
jgi:Micrococcal nuclease (thermonuclease) homologs